MLIIFSGAPGTGKTTLSRQLARQLGAVYLRIDTMDQPIMAVYGADIADVSFRVAYGVARDNLKLGHVVVTDCVNDVNVTRDAWRDVALAVEVPVVEIEVICSDVAEHRRRIETRLSDIPGFTPPSWLKICDWKSDPWRRERIVIDTNGRAVEDCVTELGPPTDQRASQWERLASKMGGVGKDANAKTRFRNLEARSRRL